MADLMRCPRCGAQENEVIEDSLYGECGHEVYFETIEGPNGDVIYICSECGKGFDIAESDSGILYARRV